MTVSEFFVSGSTHEVLAPDYNMKMYDIQNQLSILQHTFSLSVHSSLFKVIEQGLDSDQGCEVKEQGL